MAPTRLIIAVAAGALVLLAPASSARAAAGTLDPSFDGDGRVETAVRGHSDTGWAVAVQPDGKLVVAGSSKASANWALSDYDILLARYLPDGTLDPAFGSGGTVVTALSAGDDQAFALALQPDGKIVVAGQASNGADLDVAVLRYLADGSLDSAFGGGDGIVTTPIGPGNDMGYGLAVQPDGKIVVAGERSTSCACGQDGLVARYLSNGSLDPSFGGGSGWTGAGSAGDDYASAVAVQSDGKIVVAGTASPDGTDLDFIVYRLLPDGWLDASTYTSFSATDDRAWSLGIQPDGKIVVAGTQADLGGGGGNFALARYLPNLALDSTFGGDGTVVTAVTISHDQLSSGTLLIQPDGKIVVGGDSPNFNSDAAVARYLADGSLDTSFDGDGVAVTRNDVGVETVNGLALQADGKIVAAASTGGGKLVVTRYLGAAAAPVASPGGGGDPPRADLALSGSAAASGDIVTVALRVSNDKNYGFATGISLDVQLPEGVELVSSSADRGAGCTLAAPRVVRCDLDWLFAADPYANVSLTLKATAPGKLALAASVSYGAGDPNPLDNAVTIAVDRPGEAAPAGAAEPAAEPAKRTAGADVDVKVVAGPAGPRLRLETDVPKATTAQVVLRRNGQTVLARSVKLRAGHAVVHVALPKGAPAGTYRVEIRVRGGAKVVQTVKLRRP